MEVVESKNEIIEIAAESILEEALRRKEAGYRLVQICATRVKGGNELLYSFGKDYDVQSLRFVAEDGKEIPSISHIFAPAFLYENEIHDLFGTSFGMLTIDFGGNLYRTEKKMPYKEAQEE